MFNNINLFRIPDGWDMDADRLAGFLSKARFVPCGATDEKTSGWSEPRNGDQMVIANDGQWIAQYSVEVKKVPASIVARKLDEKIKELVRNGAEVGRKQKKELKERIVQELLPKAFPKRDDFAVWIDSRNKWLVVCASSPAKADEVIGGLFAAIPACPIGPVSTNISPASAMVGWLTSAEQPRGFTIDRDCELRGVDVEKPSVKYSRISLEREEIAQHIAEGKMPVSLAMTWDDKIAFVVTDKLQIKRVKTLDILKENINTAMEQGDDEFYATLCLITGELAKLFSDLVDAFGGEAT